MTPEQVVERLMELAEEYADLCADCVHAYERGEHRPERERAQARDALRAALLAAVQIPREPTEAMAAAILRQIERYLAFQGTVDDVWIAGYDASMRGSE